MRLLSGKYRVRTFKGSSHILNKQEVKNTFTGDLKSLGQSNGGINASSR